MRLHYLKHVPYEGLACIADWANRQQFSLTGTELYKNEPLPAIADFDWLVIMGGPMAVYDEQEYDWMYAEKRFIEKTITAGKTVIGICLGAQMIADVLGAKVYKNKEKEIGWFPVYGTAEAQNHPLFDFIAPELSVFHWHGDTFALPHSAVHLFYSEATRNQAFIYAEKVIGLQFHFEANAGSINQMVENGLAELTPGEYIQSVEEIGSELHRIEQNNQIMFEILNRLSQ